MTRHWLNVISKEHVLRGVELGIVQANHGKRSAVERMRPGDTLIYYSPREGIRSGAAVRAFTAIGTVDDGPAWQADPVDLPDGGCFQPWRRSVSYRTDAKQISVEQLRGELDLTSSPNWGMVLRRGLIELTAHDHAVIARAMADQ
ncbi:EVE domain-containing protein [Nocardia tenerifensis]|uniref:EVE domain-containing protein n=1 Tax=Nocardia tenerifensis TaxID=228006 RepID=A0A318KKW7_9NOCA|nr:EVE domain-containing protein [Nocardia tenerifensis]PXX69067.1 EVE domain-containing protein [Nocardia tenerifensis]